MRSAENGISAGPEMRITEFVTLFLPYNSRISGLPTADICSTSHPTPHRRDISTDFVDLEVAEFGT